MSDPHELDAHAYEGVRAPMTAGKNISYAPTAGLSYDPSEEKYWDHAALHAEVERVFEVCHGCRLCFKYCDSFPRLFKFIDDDHGGDVRLLSAPETREVMDACFQCKLCEVECPYTPRENHPFQLDFPKLVHRYKAVAARHEEKSLRDLMLSNPDASAQFARLSLGLANAMNKVPLHRRMMEAVLGIHRDKLLPDFASQTFERWAAKKGLITGDTQVEAVLFQTCYVQNNEPEIGQDTLEVMAKNQVQVGCAAGLACCGMPAWEIGDLGQLQRQARQNLDVLEPYVEAGAKVLVINPTCSMMLRKEYPELLEGKDRARAVKLSAAVRDTGEYLWSIRNEPRFSTDFLSSPGEKVAYHAPCHLRAQRAGMKGRDLLRKIPGVTPVSTMECCGHDGTYAMKTESFEDSKRIGQKAFDGMSGVGAEVWATECPLAAKQFEQHAGQKALHPMTILARAYRPDGFPHKVKKD